MKVYQAGEAQTADEIIVEFDFMWSGQQVGKSAYVLWNKHNIVQAAASTLYCNGL